MSLSRLFSTLISHPKQHFKETVIQSSNLDKSFESSGSDFSQSEDTNYFTDKNDDSIIEVTSIDDVTYKPPHTLMISIAKVIERLLNESHKTKLNIFKNKKIQNSSFNSIFVPEISILDYLKRIDKYANINESTFIIALIYIDRISQSKYPITEHNIHKLLFASILVAIKFNEDNFYRASYYAQIAGVSLKELTKMEYEFLCLIDFNGYVEKALFMKYKKGLVK